MNYNGRSFQSQQRSPHLTNRLRSVQLDRELAEYLTQFPGPVARMDTTNQNQRNFALDVNETISRRVPRPYSLVVNSPMPIANNYSPVNAPHSQWNGNVESSQQATVHSNVLTEGFHLPQPHYRMPGDPATPTQNLNQTQGYSRPHQQPQTTNGMHHATPLNQHVAPTTSQNSSSKLRNPWNPWRPWDERLSPLQYNYGNSMSHSLPSQLNRFAPYGLPSRVTAYPAASFNVPNLNPTPYLLQYPGNGNSNYRVVVCYDSPQTVDSKQAAMQHIQPQTSATQEDEKKPAQKKVKYFGCVSKNCRLNCGRIPEKIREKIKEKTQKCRKESNIAKCLDLNINLNISDDGKKNYYSFDINGEKISVCRMMFMQMTGISNKNRIMACIENKAFQKIIQKIEMSEEKKQEEEENPIKITPEEYEELENGDGQSSDESEINVED